MVYYANDGLFYDLTTKIKEGGEGIVYEISNNPGIVAKIFKERDRSRDLKVEALSKLPWSDEVRKYLVLPKAALYEDSDKKILRGYIMEKIEYTSTLADVYSETNPLSIYKKSCIAENLCRAVISVHNTGNIVIGDFNSKNILVDRTNGNLKIIDVDSLHMCVKRAGVEKRFPCVALDPILFMPEILNAFQLQKVKRLDEIEGETFTKYTDYYCLAYHIHMLLMAQKPFGAAMDRSDIDNSVPAPTAKSMACRGQYAYVNLPARTSLPKIYPNFDILTPRLQDLFIRAFKDGASDPTKRPTADDFLSALKEYTAGLRYCLCKGFDHYLYKDYRSPHCEWCRVESEKHQERKIAAEDLYWMTEDELLHLIDVTSFLSLKSRVYLELGQRYSGNLKKGIRANTNIHKAKMYYKKALHMAKKDKNKSLEESIKKLLKCL